MSYSPFDALLPRLVKRCVALRLTARSSVWQWTETLHRLHNDTSIASACRHHAWLMADRGDAADRIADQIESLRTTMPKSP